MRSERASVCPLDCPDTCSLTVTVEDERIVQIRGSRANPYTASVICTKVARDHADFVHGDRRLTTPLRRVGAKGEGRFEPLTWDAALDLIHARVSAAVRAHGPQSVLPLNYAGPHGMLAYASIFDLNSWAEWLVLGAICFTAVGVLVAVSTRGD